MSKSSLRLSNTFFKYVKILRSKFLTFNHDKKAFVKLVKLPTAEFFVTFYLLSSSHHFLPNEFLFLTGGFLSSLSIMLVTL